ncbi:MAG: DEAD/DEAH box helicase family protein [Actinomycetota bacterium]|nr:DEAD/DEAH box helicase family protein [Actinomycetota bacterium]
MRYRASARQLKGGLAGIVGKEATLLEEMLPSEEHLNEFVNELREELRIWRHSDYLGTSMVTRKLLYWWFEREDERRSELTRFFFCQREAIEAVIYLYEVKGRQRMPETGDLVRYALKLATGTGKTLVMALLIVWATLHKAKVSGSSLSHNFLVLVPNLTVRDRVRGVDARTGLSTGAGLDPASPENLYEQFNIVPAEYTQDFNPRVLVRNWQSVPLASRRDDWIPEDVDEKDRFVPASVHAAMQKRRDQDPNAVIRRFLEGWRDLIIINDEAHHVYGEKRTRRGEDPGFIKWSRIIDRIRAAASIAMVVDFSATPWYGTGSPKPEGTLFEWMVSDFSVYDAFESGLVKVVRLPDPDEAGRVYLDLWDLVKDAKTKEEYLRACKGAVEHIYSGWKRDYHDWVGQFELMRPGPPPVMLVVANDAVRARWLFEHLSTSLKELRNPDTDDPTDWLTIQIDSKVFDADRGNEAVLREIVNTVGKKGKPGEHVRCIISVNMLSEGWDVKNVTHIMGLRAFGSPLLTEQVIGRGLRRTDYTVLNEPLEERLANANRPDEETVDAFGIPFIGFPVERRKRAAAGKWGQKPTPIQPDPSKDKFGVRMPNVRSWAVGVNEPLVKAIPVESLEALVIDSKETPTDVRVRPVIGGNPEEIMTVEEFRKEFPVVRSTFILARELLESTHPDGDTDSGTGPTFEELLDFVSEYLAHRVSTAGSSHVRDIGMYYWTRRALDILETAVQGAPSGSITTPVLGSPRYLDSTTIKQFNWTGITAKGKKSNLSRIACHTQLEADFADFIDSANDVVRYLKNERFGFSVTYYENNRPRQYYPDFIVLVKVGKSEVWWLVETKGEVRTSTILKRQAAHLWCDRMTRAEITDVEWRDLFVQQRRFERAQKSDINSFTGLVDLLDRAPSAKKEGHAVS